MAINIDTEVDFTKHVIRCPHCERCDCIQYKETVDIIRDASLFQYKEEGTTFRISTNSDSSEEVSKPPITVHCVHCNKLLGTVTEIETTCLQPVFMPESDLKRLKLIYVNNVPTRICTYLMYGELPEDVSEEEQVLIDKWVEDNKLGGLHDVLELTEMETDWSEPNTIPGVDNGDRIATCLFANLAE